MTQSVKRLTLNSGSGHDLMVQEFEPHLKLCADRAEPAWDSLSPSLSLPLARSCLLSLFLSLSLSLKIKKHLKKDLFY